MSPKRNFKRRIKLLFALQPIDELEEEPEFSQGYDATKLADESHLRTLLSFQYQKEYLLMIIVASFLSAAIAASEVMFVHVYLKNDVRGPQTRNKLMLELFYFIEIIFIIDLVLRLCYKLWALDSEKLRNSEAPIETMLVNFITCLPLEICYMYARTDPMTIALLRLRVLLRVFRVISANLLLLEDFTAQGIKMAFFRMACIQFSLIISLAMYHYVLYCEPGKCETYDYLKFVEIFYVSMRNTIGAGAYISKIGTDPLSFLYVAANFLFLLHSFYMISILTCIRITQLRMSYRILQKIENVRISHRVWKKKYKDTWSDYDERVIYTMKNYLYDFNKHRDGCLENRVLYKIIPEAVTNYVKADACLDALLHSTIFRNQPNIILRFVANLMEFEFGVPGDKIISQGIFNQKMIYISRGVLQFFSQENGETPTLSLSAGSCLCESNLFYAFKGPCNVVCQTYCELIVLKSSSFREIVKIHPDVYKIMLGSIKHRVKKAKIWQNIPRRRPHERRDYVLSWIKLFHTNIMNRKKIPEVYDKGLVYDRNNCQKPIENLNFNVLYMDKIVVSDEIHLVRDSVFLKKRSHFILQPNAPVLNIWDALISVLTISFLGIYPYCVTFSEKYTEGAIVLTYIVSVAFVLDVYLQLATAPETTKEVTVTMKFILYQRLKSTYFFFDCIAMVPFELLMHIIGGNIENRYYFYLMCNKLIKYYRVNNIFHEKILHQKLVTYAYTINFLLNAFLLFYYICFLLYLINCPGGHCSQNFLKYFNTMGSYNEYTGFVAIGSISMSLLSGLYFGDIPDSSGVITLLYIAISYFFYIFTFTFLSGIAAKHALLNFDELEDQESLSNANKLIDESSLNKSYKNKMKIYLEKLWYFRNYRDTTYNISKRVELHEKEFRSLTFYPSLTKNIIFRALPRDFVKALCSYATRHIVPANTQLCFFNHVSACITFIESGRIRVTTTSGNSKIMGKNTCLGLISLILNRPLFYDVLTLTDCIILEIPKKDFNKILEYYSFLKKILVNCYLDEVYDIYLKKEAEEALQELKGPRKIDLLILKTKQVLGAIIRLKTMKAFKKIKTVFQSQSRKCTLNLISLRGNFIFYWELSRCIAIFANCILSFTKSFTQSGKVLFWQYFFLYSLDIFSLADLILRFFITFYDRYGFEIKSIQRTLLRYLSHSFLIDFLGSFPFDLVYRDNDILFTRINRLLLMYRVISFNYYITDNVSRTRQFLFVYILLLVIIACTHISSTMMYYYCPINYDLISSSVKYISELPCYKNSWINKSTMERPVTIQKTYMESYLMLISFFFGISYKQYILGSWEERLFILVFAAAGYFIKVICLGKFLTYCLFQNADLSLYQHAMKNLVSYLSYCKMDKGLKSEVINYFEYIWENNRPNNFIEEDQRFPLVVKQEMLFQMYGSYFTQNQMFKNAEIGFVRALLMIGKHRIFLNTGILYRINDVNENIYYLLNGNIDVMGPDKNRLTVLYPGSLAGCLDKCTMTRTTLTMVARGHVETMVFKSIDFHDVLSSFPDLRKIFMREVRFNNDYMESTFVPSTTDVSVSDYEISLDISRRCQGKIRKPNKKLHYFYLSLYIFQFIFGTPMELLVQISRPTPFLYLCLYANDFAWILRSYYIFHTAYENEYGLLVFNRKEIAQNYIAQRFGFIFDFFCNVPLDLIEALDFSRTVPYLVYIILRFNRLFRVLHLYLFIIKRINQLHVNLIFIRSLYVIICLGYWVYILYSYLFLFAHDWKISNKTINETTKLALEYASMILKILSETCTTLEYANSRLAIAVVSSIVVIHIILILVFYSTYTSTIQIVTKIRAEYIITYRKILKFSEVLSISKPIVDVITAYIDLLYKHKDGIQYPGLLDKAPIYLREAVIDSMFGFHLRNSPVLKDCHDDFLRQLAGSVKTTTYFKDNYIAFEGDINDTCYFIHEGIILAVNNYPIYPEIVEHILRPGTCFGLRQMLFGKLGHNFTYKAAKLCVIIELERKALLKYLKFFPASQQYIYSHDFSDYVV